MLKTKSQMPDRIVISGLGIISSIGIGVEECISSLKLERSGIGKLKYFDSIHKDEIPVAEVKASSDELYEMADVKDEEVYTRTSLLGMIAAKEALRDSGLNKSETENAGMVSATTVGGMVKSENHYLDFLQNNNSNKYIGTHDCGDSTEKIANFLGIKGYRTTISTACSSGANAMMHGARLIRHSIVDKVIVGGTDALSRFTLNGFNTLMILDRTQCHPFDENRNGLTIGEGAAYLVIESEKSFKGSGRKCYGYLSGYSNANDAYHQTASSPEGTGAIIAMRNALDKAGLKPEDIDYINAHGTGTINNDLTEGVALQEIFKGNIPPMSSTKPYTGHTLGAAGSVEAVFSLLAINKGFLLPNLNFKIRMKELDFSPVESFQDGKEIKNVLSNSFGFGGNNTTLIFSKE